jgi:hypothetical protein
MELLMDESHARKILELHSEFLRRLDRHEPPLQPSVPLILTRILECDEEILEFSLGQFGQKLRRFADKVDFSHPEIISIFGGILADDQDFSKECLELLILAQYARDNQLTKIIPLLGKTAVKETLSSNVIKKIDPHQNRMYVRLLKNPWEREEIRLTKRMQIIDLQGLYSKGEEIWNAQPDSFSKFLRFDTAYQADLKVAEQKAATYEELGCTSLADEIKKTIATFREHMEHSHYGFNRITMTNATIILAKSLGFTYTPAQEISGGFVGSYKTEAKITVNRKFFGKYNFDPEQIIELNPIVSEFARSPVFTVKDCGPYQYQPRVYPLHDFWDLASEELQDIIKMLENFPDAGGKPIFDHFGVIVPSVALPQQAPKGNVFIFLDEKGMTKAFTSKEDAEKDLDSILIKNEYLTPIVIGEKDGKCYFLTYFTVKKENKEL